MTTYRIIRFIKDGDDNGNTRVEMETGLTLEEAQAHTNDPETSSKTATGTIPNLWTEKYGEWFDGYEAEE